MLGSFTLLRGAKLPNNILYGHRQAGQLFLKICVFFCDCAAQKHPCIFLVDRLQGRPAILLFVWWPARRPAFSKIR
jgi:hypothetical protein